MQENDIFALYCAFNTLLNDVHGFLPILEIVFFLELNIEIVPYRHSENLATLGTTYAPLSKKNLKLKQFLTFALTHVISLFSLLSTSKCRSFLV